MEQKTSVKAQEGQQDLLISRVFELPVALLFKAYVEPDIVAQWMGTQVLQLESRKQGYYQFETTDAQGNKHGFSGVIHELIPNQKIIRTFEMERSPYGVQLECYDFIALTAQSSQLNMHVIYESVAQRDQVLKLPFAQGINMAHQRIEDMLNKLK